MTRISATPDGTPTDRIGSYYSRFGDGGFGLIITEGLYTDRDASQGYLNQPGIADDAHAAAWRPLVEQIQRTGAKVFAQLMHAGAQSQGNPHRPGTVGPSAIRPRGNQLSFYRGSGPFPVPSPLSLDDIEQIREGFVRAAKQACAAGFDGVEIHGANGYLLDQFLTDYLNQRTDCYGGETNARIRLLAEVCRDVASAVGSDITTGVRISQSKVADFEHEWAAGEEDARIIFGTLGHTGIDYIHTTQSCAWAPAFAHSSPSLAAFAKRYSGLPVIANGSLGDPTNAATLLSNGDADVVALGKPALADRDWPQKAGAGESVTIEVPGHLLGPLADVKPDEVRVGADDRR